MKRKNRYPLFLTLVLVLSTLSLFSAVKCWKIVGWKTGGGMDTQAGYAVLAPADCSRTEQGFGWVNLDVSRAETASPDTYYVLVNLSDPKLPYINSEALVFEGIDEREAPILRCNDNIYPPSTSQELTLDSPLAAKCSCVPYNKSMVAWFPFDETEGNIAYNMFGPQDGELINQPEHVTGMVANALKFDGINDYIVVADHPQVNLGTGDFSIETWIKTTDSSGNIVSKRYYHDSPGYLFMVYGSRILLQMTDNILGWCNYYDYNGPQVTDNQWHHVAVTVDRDNPQGGTFYLDGEPVYTFNPTGRQGSLDTSANLWIGQEGGGGKYFAGLIDELSLYKKVLSPLQIKDIYLAGAHGKCKITPLSVSLKVNTNRKGCLAFAYPKGGTGKYLYSWYCSTNLKLINVFTNKKHSKATFHKVTSAKPPKTVGNNGGKTVEPAWVEVTVTDTTTMKSITEREEFNLYK